MEVTVTLGRSDGRVSIDLCNVPYADMHIGMSEGEDGRRYRWHGLQASCSIGDAETLANKLLDAVAKARAQADPQLAEAV